MLKSRLILTEVEVTFGVMVVVNTTVLVVVTVC